MPVWFMAGSSELGSQDAHNILLCLQAISNQIRLHMNQPCVAEKGVILSLSLSGFSQPG